ncbi:MAG: hypothetical protein VX435_09815 [Planctomycetota bacterium]|nr:hypothetical protein [Planctomycetota bacterium]
MALSSNSGKDFQHLIALDKQRPSGRPAVTILDDRSTVITWLRPSGKQAELRAAHVTADGRVTGETVIAPVSAGRASGFPRLTADGRSAIVTWTQGTPPQSFVRAVRLSFDP